jgi:hypothetical protein
MFILSALFNELFSKYNTRIPPDYVFCVCSDIILVFRICMSVQAKSHSDLSVLNGSGYSVLHWLSGLRPSSDTLYLKRL